MEEKDWKKLRKYARGSVTRLVTKANSVMVEGDSKDILAVKCTLSTKFEHLQNLDQKIMESWIEDEEEDGEIEAEMDEVLEYELLVSKTLSALEEQLKTNDTKRPVLKSENSEIKLPKFSLPSYSGSKVEWLTFWELFIASVDKKSSLADVQKFAYLKNCLHGEAKSAIEGLALIEENYSEAKEILQTRFGNKLDVSRMHLEKLREMKCVSGASGHLRQFYDNISSHSRNLAKLDVHPEQYEVMLLPSLISKLPETVKLNLLHKASLEKAEISRLKYFLQLLDDEIKIIELAKGSISDCGQGSKPGLSTVSALPTSINNASKSQKKESSKNSINNTRQEACVYCRGEHYSLHCTTVKDVTERALKLRKENRCFRCLRANHYAKVCRSDKKCSVCHKNHHTSICKKSAAAEKSANIRRDEPVGTSRTPINDSANVTEGLEIQNTRNEDCATVTTSIREGSTMFIKSSGVVMPMAKVVVQSPNGDKEIVVRLLFDSASNKSFIRRDLVENLGITLQPGKKLQVNTFGGKSTFLEDCPEVSFNIRKLDSHTLLHLECHVVPEICSQPKAIRFQQYPHFLGLDLADPNIAQECFNETEIGILVGADQFYNIVEGDVRRGKFGPVAVSSKLGWLACGTLDVHYVREPENLSMASIMRISAVDEQLQKFWELEHVGILPNEDEPQFLPEQIRMENGRYVVSLPWKAPKEDIALPSNFHLSKRRLQTTLRKIKSNENYFKEYNKIFSDQLKKGVIEVVPDDATGSIIHYLPHSPVIKPHSSTKLRIVMDASAKDRSSLSLNDCLQKGSPSLPKIPKILCEFRTFPIAILADIEKAFLQIGICETDRDCLRFLWVESERDEKFRLIIYRYTSLVFGLSCSPNILERVLSHHISKYVDKYPEVVTKIANHIYVDNLITGCKTQAEAELLYDVTKLIFDEGHFNMRQWNSSSMELLQYIRQKNASDVLDNIQESKGDISSLNGLPVHYEDVAMNGKVLGMAWNPHSDEFIFHFRDFNKESGTCWTKRMVLQTVASIYDPLGLISPLLILPKLLFQELCGSRRWDDQLSEEQKRIWNDWIVKLSKFEVSVPRYLNSDDAQLELHGFADASQNAYAAVLYLKVTLSDGSVDVNLLASKSRVAPLKKKLTIPRLELLSAVLLTRLVEFFRPVFPKATLNLWLDSMNAICWIRREDQIWKTFIQNRVTEIRRATSPSVWNHISGKSNPADIPSRGIDPGKLKNCKTWWKGPLWLSCCEPTETETLTFTASTDELAESTTIVTDCSKFPQKISNLMSITHFSSYDRLLRVTCYVLRFMENLKFSKKNCSPISAIEISEAETLWIKDLQEKHFRREIDHIKLRGAETSRNRNLNLFLDNKGILRCRGRISKSEVHSCNDPILLPTDAHLEKLIILRSHEFVFHGGARATLAKIRESFWIVKGYQKVKKHLRKCVVCKFIQGLSFQTPPAPQLPAHRVSFIRAFSTVGLDYCGPVYYVDRKGEVWKCHIALFTCTSVRAVHLEVVDDLTATSFIQCLKRFVARRGIPNIISDNATTFHAASKSAIVQEFAASRRIKWEWIVPYSPWMGGFYERLIKELKLALKKTVKRRKLTYQELITVVTEIEGVLNSRPLLYTNEEVEEVITPSHFLILQRLTKNGEPTCPWQLNVPSLKYARSVLNSFWDHWHKFYIASLRERSLSGVHQKRGTPGYPKAGDVCYLVDKTPRLRWKLVKVLSINTSRDGIARSAMVLIGSGERNKKCVRRPISQLVPLECNT